MKNRRFPFALVLALTLATIASLPSLIVHAQTQAKPVQPVDVDGNQTVLTRGAMVYYTPAKLGANAITLPASTTTASFPAIPANVASADAFTLAFNCGQAVDVYVQAYADTTGATALGTYKLITAAAAGEQQISVSQYAVASITSGTAAIAFRLPQHGLKFSFTNNTATPSTCTARLMVKY